MTSIVFVFIMPIGLGNIGWKMYMVNASWDIIILFLIVSSQHFIVCAEIRINEPRGITGLKPRGRRSRKSTPSSRARNIRLCPILSRFVPARQLSTREC